MKERIPQLDLLRGIAVLLVLYLLASITSGMFMGKIIEMRALAIRERYFPSERSARSVNWTAGQSPCAVEV